MDKRKLDSCFSFFCYLTSSFSLAVGIGLIITNISVWWVLFGILLIIYACMCIYEIA